MSIKNRIKGILARVQANFEAQVINKEIARLVDEKNLPIVHIGRNNIDAYELRAKKVFLYGNGKIQVEDVDRIMFGFGDDYITLFRGEAYKEVPGLLLKDVEV